VLEDSSKVNVPVNGINLAIHSIKNTLQTDINVYYLVHKGFQSWIPYLFNPTNVFHAELYTFKTN